MTKKISMDLDTLFYTIFQVLYSLYICLGGRMKKIYWSFSGLPEVSDKSAGYRLTLYKKLKSELKLGAKFTQLMALSVFCSILALGVLASLGFTGDSLGAIGFGVMFLVWMVGHTLMLNRVIHPALKTLCLDGIGDRSKE